MSPVARLVSRPVLTVTLVRSLQYWHSDCVALSLNFSLAAKISNLERPLWTRTYSIQNHKWKPDRAHSCFPRVSRHTRRLATKTAIALLATPPGIPTAPGSPGVPCSEYTHAHETKEEKGEKELEKTKNRWKGPASKKGRRFPRGSSERPGMYQPSTFREGNICK